VKGKIIKGANEKSLGTHTNVKKKDKEPG